MSHKDKYVKIMDVEFLHTTRDSFVSQTLARRLRNGEKTFIVTANPEILMEARADNHYKQAVQQADYVVADGIGIVKAAKKLKRPLPERIAGFDVMMDLLKKAEEDRLSCFFLGASEQVNHQMIQQIRKQYPELEIAGARHGYNLPPGQLLAKEVQKSDADIVFVALGLPRQELWIAEHLHIFDKGLFIGVGGSFDVIAGEVKRAPNIWIRLNLEWLYRLIKQPARLKRIWKVFQFMFLVVIGKVK